MKLIYLIAFIFCFIFSLLELKSQDLLGQKGSFESLEISGAQFFQVEEIKKHLRKDLEVQLLRSPYRQTNDYIAALINKVKLGYLASGFKDVYVGLASIDENKIKIKVVEGQRSLMGSISIISEETIKLASLNEYIKNTKENGFFWVEGSPVDYSNGAESYVRKSFGDLLFKLGYLESKSEIEMIGEKNVVSLNVEIKSFGEIGVLEKINIFGNELTSKNDILSFLEFKPSIKITPGLINKFIDKLLSSGFFKVHGYDTKRIGVNLLEMNIYLSEIKWVMQHLNFMNEFDHYRRWNNLEPINTAELNLIKFLREKLKVSHRFEPRFQIKYDDVELDVQTKDDQGFIANITLKGSPEENTIFYLVDNKIGLLFKNSKEYFEIELMSDLELNLNFLLTEKEEEITFGDRSDFKLGGFIKTREPNAPIFNLITKIDINYWLALLATPDTFVEANDKEWQIKTTNRNVMIDNSTIFKFKISELGDWGKSTLSVSPENGWALAKDNLFKSKKQSLQLLDASKVNKLIRNFVFNTAVSFSKNIDRRNRVLGLFLTEIIVRGNYFDILKRLFKDSDNESEESKLNTFPTPSYKNYSLAEKNLAMFNVVSVFLDQSDNLFEHGSWQWGFIRFVVCFMFCPDKISEDDLRNLCLQMVSSPVSSCLAATFFEGISSELSVNVSRAALESDLKGNALQEIQGLFGKNPLFKQLIFEMLRSVITEDLKLLPYVIKEYKLDENVILKTKNDLSKFLKENNEDKNKWVKVIEMIYEKHLLDLIIDFHKKNISR